MADGVGICCGDWDFCMGGGLEKTNPSLLQQQIHLLKIEGHGV